MVSNNGAATATGVTVQESLSHLAVMSVGGGCASFPCDLGSLAWGESVTLTVQAQINGTGPFSNTASVSSTTTDPVLANNNATAGGNVDGTTPPPRPPNPIPTLGEWGQIIMMLMMLLSVGYYSRRAQRR